MINLFLNLEQLIYKLNVYYYNLSFDYIFIDFYEEDKMIVDGVMKFLEDLSLSLEFRIVLFIAWKFKVVIQCEFIKEEFVNGMIELK